MRDPSTLHSWSPSTDPSLIERPSLPQASPDARPFVHSEDVHEGLLGYAVVSATGEELGRIVGILADTQGRARKLAFVEAPGDEPRFVPLKFVREIAAGAVRLAGPREGYHITRVRARRMAEVVETPWDEA